MYHKIVKVSELQPGDVVRAWEDGDPWTSTVKTVEVRPVHTTTSAQLQWTYDVTYESGYTAFSQDGDSQRKVVTPK
jgi:hypothetical protein